ncbi:MAG: hypothetical protein GAK45_01964 [Pseudomonas citronellolis]|nr:MAG: hypothetical protein GAK45_01964 [Pseudomonas citronellolis]
MSETTLEAATDVPSLTSNFQAFLGLERTLEPEGVARVYLRRRPELMNFLQQFHGGVLMSVLDAAMAGAIRASDPHCSMVTIDMSTHFIGLARAELQGVGRVLRRTRTLCFCSAEIHNEDGELVAVATGSFKVRHDPEAAAVAARESHSLNRA